MRYHASALFFLVFGLLAACDGGDGPASGAMPVTSASTATPPGSSTATAAAPASPSSSATPAVPAPAGTAFVRHPPHSHNSDADAVDECTQSGGNYFSCRGAYFDEQDPVLKRYLYRIAQGHAAGVSSYGPRGPSDESPPHAEVPFMCDVKKPCGAKNEHGDLNSAMSCLALALTADNVATARAAHALACKCNSTEGAFPGYNGSAYVCDEKGRPAFIAPKMKKDEGADIVDCAICHPQRGPAACQREIARLKASDAELAAHVETKQIRRCQTPNDGPYTWDQR
jgi:hypothetical protein